MKSIGTVILCCLLSVCVCQVSHSASMSVKGGKNASEKQLREIEESTAEDRAAKNAAGLHGVAATIAPVVEAIGKAVQQGGEIRLFESGAPNALNMECNQTGELLLLCREAKCSGIKGDVARELCISGPSSLLRHSYEDRYRYLWDFIENGFSSKKFGENQYAAERLVYTTKGSKQARMEFAIYHLSGMKIYIK